MILLAAKRVYNLAREHYSKSTTAMWGGSFWFMKPPKDVSLDGYRIDAVIQYTDFIIGIYFGIVVLFMLYAIIRYRSRPGHVAVYDKGDSRKNIVVTLALGLTVFLTVDVVIESMAFRDLREAFWNFPKGEDVIRIEVMPQQYAWNVRYAGEDGIFATDDDLVPDLNQVHIPVNTPVIIQLTPYDVIHSFYLPNFRVKQDATPGMVTAMWIQATETGQFEIACAELCGNAHYRMRGILTVQTQEEFAAWLDGIEPEVFDEFDWEDDADSSIPIDWGWPWKEII